jgi:hypothetical protein
LLEAQLAEVWALPLDFTYQSTALEKGSIDPDDLQVLPFREKRVEFEKRVQKLTTAHNSQEREQCELFQQDIEALSSALNKLQHSDIKALSSELAALNAAITSWTALLEEEHKVWQASQQHHPALVTVTFFVRLSINPYLLQVNEAAKQAASARVTQLFDRLNELQLQAQTIYDEQIAWIEGIQKKCTHNESVIRSVTLHLDLEIQIRTAAKNIADLRRQVDDLITSPVTSPRTVQQSWIFQCREMKAEVEKFEKSFEQEKQSIEKSVRAALAQSESLGQELMTQRLERLELLSASTLEVAAAVLASQQDSRLALATLPSSAVVDEDFVTSLNDRYSQASTGAVPLVQSSISRAQSIIVDGSEQQFLNGIARARDELAMVLPRITNLHSKLLSHNGVRSSYYDVATAMLDNLAVNCNVYSGVDYTSLTHATQQLLGQASTSNSLPVPYVPEPQVASQVPPGD